MNIGKWLTTLSKSRIIAYPPSLKNVRHQFSKKDGYIFCDIENIKDCGESVILFMEFTDFKTIIRNIKLSTVNTVIIHNTPKSKLEKFENDSVMKKYFPEIKFMNIPDHNEFHVLMKDKKMINISEKTSEKFYKSNRFQELLNTEYWDKIVECIYLHGPSTKPRFPNEIDEFLRGVVNDNTLSESDVYTSLRGWLNSDNLNFEYIPVESRDSARIDIIGGLLDLTRSYNKMLYITDEDDDTITHRLGRVFRVPPLKIHTINVKNIMDFLYKYTSDDFPVIFCLLKLCKIADIMNILPEIHRVLKPGGRFVIQEYNSESPLESIHLDIIKNIFSISLGTYSCEPSPPRTYYTKEFLHSIIINFGFEIVQSTNVDVQRTYYTACTKPGVLNDDSTASKTYTKSQSRILYELSRIGCRTFFKIHNDAFIERILSSSCNDVEMFIKLNGGCLLSGKNSTLSEYSGVNTQRFIKFHLKNFERVLTLSYNNETCDVITNIIKNISTLRPKSILIDHYSREITDECIPITLDTRSLPRSHTELVIQKIPQHIVEYSVIIDAEIFNREYYGWIIDKLSSSLSQGSYLIILDYDVTSLVDERILDIQEIFNVLKNDGWRKIPPREIRVFPSRSVERWKKILKYFKMIDVMYISSHQGCGQPCVMVFEKR